MGYDMTDENALKLAVMIGEMRSDLLASIHTLQTHVLALTDSVRRLEDQRTPIPRERLPSFASTESGRTLESIRVEAQVQTPVLEKIAIESEKQTAALGKRGRWAWVQPTAVAIAVFVYTIVNLLGHK
jgi:hypothetical protein